MCPFTNIKKIITQIVSLLKGNCYLRSANVCLIDTPVLSFIIGAVKPVTMMSGEEPPKRRRGVQIQSFTLHQGINWIFDKSG